MNVLAINSSPMMDKGNTALILEPLLDGMRLAGADVELFYTKKLEIKLCQGEHTCWFKTPGNCFQNDDMQELYPKFKEADIWVFATPLYWGSITAPLKNLIDRLLPLLDARIDISSGRCHQTIRNDVIKGKVVVVSTCGLWEIENFYPMLAHMRTFSKMVERELVGALLRPHSTELKRLIGAGRQVDDILDAARKAGNELVMRGEMSAANYNTISRNIVSLDRFVRNSNRGFDVISDRRESKWL